MRELEMVRDKIVNLQSDMRATLKNDRYVLSFAGKSWPKLDPRVGQRRAKTSR